MKCASFTSTILARTARVTLSRRSLFMPANVSLDSIIDVEKLAKEDTATIREIWQQYHAAREGISAVIPTETYNHMKQRALAAPNFVIPMPREKGFVNTFFQAQGNYFLFTSLAKYKEMGLNADTWLTIRNFVEFADRGIVLMRGEISGNQVTSLEAQYLYNQIRLHLFDESKYKLMREFNTNPAGFDFDKMLKEMSSLSGVADTFTNKN